MTFGGSSTHKAQASHSQVPESSGESEVDDEVDEPPPSQQPKPKDLTVQTGVQNSSRVDEPPASRPKPKNLTVKTGVQKSSRKSPGTSLKDKTKSSGPTSRVQKGTLPQHEIVTCFILLFDF